MKDELGLDGEQPTRLNLEPSSPDGRRPEPVGYVPAAPDQPHLSEYLRVVYKRRWMAGAVFLIVALSVAVVTFTTTPIYEARTRLLIEASDPNVVSFQEVIDQQTARTDYQQTQHNILRSRALARKTLDSLKLWDSPPFGGQADKPATTSMVAGLIGRITTVFASEEEPAEAPGADETVAESQAIDAFLAHLDIEPVRNSRLVDVTYRLPDPALATRIVNALARNYIDQNLEYRFMASQEATDWLGSRLDEQRKQVEAAEARLQQYREQNDAISLEDRENIVVQKLTDLNAAVTRAKTLRIEKEALYNQLQANQNNAALLDTFPAILSNVFIQQQKSSLAELQRQHAALSEKFGDKHPEIVRMNSAIAAAQSRLNGEVAKVVQSVRSEYQSALAQENSLVRALNEQKAEAQAMNRKAIDYSVLQRDVDSAKQIYDSLLQRARETDIAGELKSSNIRIIDPAERPRGPVVPRTRLNLLLGFVGGAGLALVLVFFVDYLDNRIKSPDEIKAHLGVPFLGMLQTVKAEGGGPGGYPLLSKGVPALFSESFRTVRTNVLFSLANDGPRSLLVTSTGPGEGKSVIAANLAVALAQTGARTLLIDADLRKPKAHVVFEQSQEPGLSNLLVGTAKASDCVRKTQTAGLWVMPAGRVPPNPSELLGSQRFRDLLTSLGGHFDWVVLDTPPVMAVTDACVMAHATSGVVFVTAAEMTSRYAAKEALDQLERARGGVIGVILNRVDVLSNPYYYSRYYRREYAQYYQGT